MTESKKRRSLWDIVRRILGVRIDALPARDMRGAINQIEPEAWQQVQYEERSHERQIHRDR